MSPLSKACSFIALSASTAAAIHQGPLKIDVDGETLELHVVSSAEKGQLFRTDDRTLMMNWGGETRGFLAGRETDDYSSSMWFNFTLLDKELSYDVDLSKVGCSCNAALFFVSMPGYNPDGSVARGVDQNPFYCDANDIGGVWCWEHDTIEANKFNVQTAPHTCDSAPGQFIDVCDKRGCSSNAYSENEHGLCPDEKCTIDTRKPFRILQSYKGNADGQLVTIANTFVQEGREFSWDACPKSEYLAQMTAAIGGKMTMTFQLWGTTEEKMKFLDENLCTGECIPEETEASFSNIAIKSLHQRLEKGEELIV